MHIKDGGVTYKNAVDATSTRAEKTDNLIATFACSLITLGKSPISYDVVVENKGSLNAKLDSINLTGGNSAIAVVTSPTNASLSTSSIVLAPNDEATITVTVSYNDINTQPTVEGLRTNITAQLIFSQTNDSPVPPAPSQETIYAWNTTAVTVGSSTINDLVSTKTAQSYYTSVSDVMSASGMPFYNVYEVVNGVIIEGLTCHTFGISGFNPVCIMGSTDGSSYGSTASGNKKQLNDLLNNQAFLNSSSGEGYCNDRTDNMSCANDYYNLSASADGTVISSVGGCPVMQCIVKNGTGLCLIEPEC